MSEAFQIDGIILIVKNIILSKENNKLQQRVQFTWFEQCLLFLEIISRYVVKAS